MTNNNVFLQLRELYKAAGISDDVISISEIAAYAAGINLVKNQIAITPQLNSNVVKIPTQAMIQQAFQNQSFSVSGKNILFSSYDKDKIGILCKDWFGPWHNISLGGAGLTWAKFDANENAFSMLDSLCYRWDMINTIKEE